MSAASPESANPASAGTEYGVQGRVLETARVMTSIQGQSVKWVCPSGTFTATGQTAKALIALVQARERGVTAVEVASWAFRLSAYVHRLRALGLKITTEREAHPGGWHGRYVLVTPVTLLKTE